MDNMVKELTSRLTFINSQSTGGQEDELSQMIKENELLKRENESLQLQIQRREIDLRNTSRQIDVI